MKSSRTSGFTLIELLTVIAIIGILAAILIPVVGRVRDSARASVCTSNMRQMGTGLILFAEENNGFAPAAQRDGQAAWNTWHSYIAPYVGFEARPEEGINWRSGSAEETVFHCPTTMAGLDGLGLDGGTPNHIPLPNGWWSYGMNTEIVANLHNVDIGTAERGDDEGRGYGLNLELVKAPTRSAAVLETTDFRARYNRTITGEFGVAPHGNGANVTFWDGSVRRYSATELLDMEENEVDLFWRGE